jgi:hypothetical protein
VFTGGGGSPALIHKGRKILLKSNLSASTFVVVLIWKRFLAIRQSNTYAAEWDPGKQILIISYIILSISILTKIKRIDVGYA